MAKTQQLPASSHLQQVLALLQQNAFGGLLVTVVSFSALCFGYTEHESSAVKLPLWVAMMAVCFTRAIDCVYWQLWLKNTPNNARQPLFRFIAGSVITALLWATYNLLLYPHIDLIELATTMVIMSAMAGGAASVLASHLTLAITYSSLLLLPLSIRAMFDVQSELNILGVLGCIFWLVMCGTAVRANQFIRSAITMKFDNQELIALTRSERAEVERINQELQSANNRLDQVNASLEKQVQNAPTNCKRFPLLIP